MTTPKFTDSQLEMIERYRDINVDYEWWDSTYEMWAEKLIEHGIHPEDMRFTGFWSQGDGASFVGKIDLKQFLRAHNLEQTYVGATFFAEREEIYVKLFRHQSMYSHANTVDVDITDDILNDYDEDDLRCTVYESMAQEYYDELKDLEEDVIGICRRYMNDFYRALQEEYEYLVSDEAVWETIEANELNEQWNHQNDEVLTN